MGETDWVRELTGDLWDEEPEPARAEADLPGHPWLSLVGKIHLATDDRGRHVYARLLWPEIRRRLGAPGSYLRGTWAPERRLTADLLVGLGSPAFMAARSEVTAIRQLPTMTHPEVARLVRSRLEAGYLLAAVEALWPSRSDILARTLWLDAGLAVWDEILLATRDELSGEIGTMEVDTPISTRWFGVLADLVRTHAPVGDAAPWRFLLAEDLAARQLPEAIRQGTLEIAERDGDILVQAPGGVWRLEEDEGGEWALAREGSSVA